MLELKHTPAFNKFNELIGQANHYLITILIGLEGVRTGKVTKEETFHVTWEPKSIEDSVRRSRQFARNSALSWAVNTLDAYLGFLGKKPFNITDNELLKEIEKRSVYQKFNAVIRSLNLEIDFPISLIHLGIQWRNNLVHFHAENELDQEYASFLRNTEKKDIGIRFRRLDPNLMLENFNNDNSPTLKEVAGFIQSIHYEVGEIDKILLKSFSAIDYCENIIKENKKEITSLMKVNTELKTRKLIRYFISRGFSTVEDTAPFQANRITVKELTKIFESICFYENH